MYVSQYPRMYVFQYCRDDMVFQHKQDMQDLRDIGYAMELRNTEQQTEAQMEFQGLVDEIKNKVRRGGALFVTTS